MLGYEAFKKVMVEQVIYFMPEEFQEYQAIIRPMNKINVIWDGLTLLSPDQEERKPFPSVYLRDLYELYLEKQHIKTVLKMAASELTERYRSMPESIGKNTFEKDSGRIIVQLINTEQNKEMLRNYPHRNFQDLSILYLYIVQREGPDFQSAMISHSLAEMMGFHSEQELYDMALDHTIQLFPPTIKAMDEVMCELAAEIDGSGQEAIVDACMEGSLCKSGIYVLSNEGAMYGAAILLYDSALHQVAERFGDDLYILPSSIHEALAVSAQGADPEELAEMVADVNRSQVDLEERLSNQVYHYDKKLHQLSIATDTPNKSLSDMIPVEPAILRPSKQIR